MITVELAYLLLLIMAAVVLGATLGVLYSCRSMRQIVDFGAIKQLERANANDRIAFKL